ncbi:MAG TPA: hypothetical protein VGV90_06115 [Solirubrobacteraceae bacterium]|nr:hypothetical protein [Solirubrobacteraceae bacterium]
MKRKIWSVRRLAPLGALALVVGAGGAQAAGGGPPDPKPVAPRTLSPAMPAAPVPMAVLPAPAPHPALSPMLHVNCRPPGQRAAAAPPSEALKDAFGILRRPRTDDDALPRRAAEALKARGLKVVDAQATRLLRADRRARAWVVPVPDVNAGSSVVCRGPRARSQSAVAPREGLVVVAVGGAPAGGGGALRDLQRGLANATVDPCAGADRDMLGVSGVVPDGVEAVFVTAADGSATRADVHDNGFSFVLPRPRRPEQRYVVWTGADGTPHVQPLPAFILSSRSRACRGSAEPIRVTPDPWGAGCAADLLPSVLPARPSRAARARARSRPRPSRVMRPRPGRRFGPPRPVAPIAPAPFPLPMALLCAGHSPPIVLPGHGPALQLPRAVPPRMRLAPPPARAPRVP